MFAGWTALSPTSGGGISSGGWSALSPAPTYQSAPAYQQSYNYSYPAFTPAIYPGAGQAAGPYGEGYYTPLDYPPMKFAAEGHEGLLRTLFGKTSSDGVAMLALGVGILALLKRK